MGKDSKHQRTKGGVQPSSSSRTAELLQKGGGGALTFLAAAAEAQLEFAGSGLPSGGNHPASSALSSLLIEDDLPPEIRLVFRKLQKKDGITKIKALTELGQLLGLKPTTRENAMLTAVSAQSSSREDSVERPSPQISQEAQEELSKTLLPHWINSYQKLTTDDSRKVRETVQITHTQICKNVGRNLAPYLKQLMPSWYLAQFDLYSPVASAAARAFKNVFPQEAKQAEVLKFCKEEVQKVISDNLIAAFRGESLQGGQQGYGGQKDKKKQKGKKGGKEEQQQMASASVTGSSNPVAGEGDETTAAAAGTGNSEGKDSESFGIRSSYASLEALSNLIEKQLVDEQILEEVFGEQGLLWSGAEVTKELLIRRSIYDLLAILSCYLRKEKDIEGSPCTFTISSGRCTKLINAALSLNQRETLPNLWNAYLILTLNGVLSDITLARKQLLTCCKGGFYSNATKIGPKVLPLLNRIWDGLGDEAKSEFSKDIVSSMLLGYSIEKSVFEKTAISRTLADTICFLCAQEVINIQPVYQFIFSNIGDLSGDFAKVLGMNLKVKDYFIGLINYGLENSSINSKEFGIFATRMCSGSIFGSDAALGNSNRVVMLRKSVKFQVPEDDIKLSSNMQNNSFQDLSEEKQSFLQYLVKVCVESHFYKTLSVISRSFSSDMVWKEANIAEINLMQEDSKLVRLQISLDLIKIFPENPVVLSMFSSEFENFQEPKDFKLFLKELDQFVFLQPVKRWIRMNVFTDVIQNLLKDADLAESELLIILKFVLRDLFPAEITSNVVDIIQERMGKQDPAFFQNLAHILASSDFKADLSGILQHYWYLYFSKSLSASSSNIEDPELELIETVCFKNLSKLGIVSIAHILENHLDIAQKPKQIDNLIEISRRLEFTGDMVGPLPKLNIKPELLSFVGESYLEVLNDNVDPMPKFTDPHSSTICRAIYKAKLAQDSDYEADLINPLFNVIYAQSLAKIWNEVQKSGYFEKKLNHELSDELDIVSSRLIEKIHENPVNWKFLWEELNKMAENSTDSLWKSNGPLRVMTDYCFKAEIQIIPKQPEELKDTFGKQVDQVLERFSRNIFDVKDTIIWLTEKRVKEPNEFEFETLYKFTKNKPFILKLLSITTELMARVEKGEETTEEFLSLGACWIAAWLKNTKYINLESKVQLHWVSCLARGVLVIGEKARNLSDLCPKFVQEYVEFHSSQIYPVIYSMYVQLNQEVEKHNFWTQQTLFYVSTAIVAIPSNTLAFIEPDSVKLCEIFGNIIGHGVSLATRIAAYRLLRKVRYDKTGEGEFPIVPPAINVIIKHLSRKINNSDDGKVIILDLISYLLIWDALLKIQQGSNEFASYVRDQEHLLTPFLNITFFSEAISLENSTGKYFEKDANLSPGRDINILHLACSVVQRALRNLPYTVRWWWNNQVSKQRDRVFVEKFIVKYLSSKLAAEELGGVKLREGVDDNVTIHCHSGCNELIAHYRIEDTNVTLTVSLPLNHPLGPVTVKISDKKLHGKISHLLNTRSHSLSAGLKLWKENLDGLYKDVDECAICFFILHNVTKQIPKLGCKTCKKKFHAACLYKWFSTSNKSECPLCRNLF